jgi:hypothetical protein
MNTRHVIESIVCLRRLNRLTATRGSMYRGTERLWARSTLSMYVSMTPVDTLLTIRDSPFSAKFAIVVLR